MMDAKIFYYNKKKMKKPQEIGEIHNDRVMQMDEILYIGVGIDTNDMDDLKRAYNEGAPYVWRHAYYPDWYEVDYENIYFEPIND